MSVDESHGPLLARSSREKKPRRRAITWTPRRFVSFASVVTILCAGGAFAASGTFGFFSATTSLSTSRFGSQTVALASNVSGSCNVSNILPGKSIAPCTMTASYSGTASALLGLDVLVESQAGRGGTPLYNPSDPSNDLQISITDNQSPNPVTYSIPTTPVSCPGDAPAGSTCYEQLDELVSARPISSSYPTITFTTSVSLPSTSPTGYQGGSAEIFVTAHAVQAVSNGSLSGCAVGQSCDANTSGAGAPGWG